MANRLGASVTIIRERTIETSSEKINLKAAEVLIRFTLI